MDRFEYISFCFNLGMNYNDILQALVVRHGVILSKSLQPRLKICIKNSSLYIKNSEIHSGKIHSLNITSAVLVRKMYSYRKVGG